MISNQSQKGGDDSTNIQAQQMVFNIGIDEKRAREICQEINLQLRKEYSREALEIAHARVNDFENKLMEKMSKIQGAMDAFADPSFQLILLEAQKTAAATERPADYDLLSELLVHRFNKAENRNARAGISLAVEIVDKVSDEALLALTVVHAVTNFRPNSGDITEGIDALNLLFEKIIYKQLPLDNQWLDHLDILNAIRINQLGGVKSLVDYYSECLPGYVDVGILKESEDHKKAIELLIENRIPDDILIEHALNNKFVRLRIKSEKEIVNLQIIEKDHSGAVVAVNNFSETQLSAIKKIYSMYSKDESIKQSNKNSFAQELMKRPNFQKLIEWWGTLSTGFNITSVGKVLAHSNAQRCDKNLPPLD